MHAAVQGEDGQLGGDRVDVPRGGVAALGQQLRVVPRTHQWAVVALAQGEAVAEGGDHLCYAWPLRSTREASMPCCSRWPWESMKEGIRVRPARSTASTSGDAWARTS